jgi:hypothetical protein
MMRLSVLAFVTLLAVIAAGGASGLDARGLADPPRIVPWKAIGNVALGMTSTRIHYEYGSARPRLINAGSASVLSDAAYRVPNGWLWVVYSRGGLVSQVGTTSPRYRTPKGIGVGFPIPLGRCHRVAGGCEYRWQGFRYSAEPCCGWIRVFIVNGRPVRVWLATVRGRVTALWVTDVRRYG